MTLILYLIVGFFGGISSGVFGIGGGAIIVPALVYFFGLSQHQAQGTCLAILLPPISILAVMRYHQEGHIHWPMAVLICAGFVFGSYFGADWIQAVSGLHLKKAFGSFLIFLGFYMIFFK